MITTSPEANPNYLAKIVNLQGLRKHPNADRLQMVTIDFQNVITGMDAKDGDIYVYFPVESKINKEFLSHINGFRDGTLNKNPEIKGFFEENCRVRAMKLRGERSQGFMIPLEQVTNFVGLPQDSSVAVDTYFDTFNGVKIIEKYIPKFKKNPGANVKSAKRPKETRIIDGQFNFHSDTENLRRNIQNIDLMSYISVTYKLHGTSTIISNTLVKRELSWVEKILLKLGVNVKTAENDYVWSSRKVIKNSEFRDSEPNHFYDEDIWTIVANEHKHKVPKGFTIYGEIVGYLPSGSPIQAMKGKAFDYGCKVGEHELYVYRVTYTNEDGLVTELSFLQISEFCEKYGFNRPRLYYTGSYNKFVKDYLGINLEDRFNPEVIINTMESLWNEKDCYMCNNKVPEEGVVLRVERLDRFEAYKLKSFKFLEGEGAQEEVDIETQES